MRTLIVSTVLVLGMSACNRAASPAVERATDVRVYVSNERSGDVSVIDAKSNQVIQTIPVGKRPRGILLSRDNRTLYVALSGSPIAGPHAKVEELPPADKSADGIGMVDLRAGRLIEKIDSGSDPEQFSLADDERLLFVSNEDVSLATVVDLRTGEILKSLKVGWEPEGVATSPDERLVYVTSETASTVHVINTSRLEIIAEFKTAERPRSIAFLPDGSKAYITCENGGSVAVVDVAASRVIKDIRPQGEMVRPMGVVISPDGRRAYVTTGRGKAVVAIDTETDEVVEIVTDVGTRPWGIGITPDGKTLYTANGPSNDVSVIDVASMRVVKRIPSGESPWGIAITR